MALVGFSQGTMMSLYVAPRRAKAPAAVVGYSGALIGPQELAEEIRSRPPVLLIHGDADPVVPHSELAWAQKALSEVGVPVTVETRPRLAHSIDERGLMLGGRFLVQRLSRPRRPRPHDNRVKNVTSDPPNLVFFAASR